MIDKTLEVAKDKGIDVSRSDIETLMEQLAEEVEQLDDEEVEDVAGGRNSDCARPSPVPSTDINHAPTPPSPHVPGLD